LADFYTSAEKYSNSVSGQRAQAKLFFWDLSDQGQLHQLKTLREKNILTVKGSLQHRLMEHRVMRNAQMIQGKRTLRLLDLKFQLSWNHFSSGINHRHNSCSNSKSHSLSLLT